MRSDRVTVEDYSMAKCDWSWARAGGFRPSPDSYWRFCVAMTEFESLPEREQMSIVAARMGLTIAEATK